MVSESLLKRLAEESLPRVVFVHGEETVWQERVYELLKQRSARDSFGEWNWSVFYGSRELNLDALTTELATVPWGGASKIVVLRDAHLVPADTLHKLVKWLAGSPQTNCLALFFQRVDENWKFLPVLRELALEIQCVPLAAGQLAQYVQEYCQSQGKDMGEAAVKQFLARVGTNLQFVHQELDKLLTFAGSRTQITEEDVAEITAFWPDQIADHTIFQLTDALAQKKRPEALRVLRQLLGAGEAPLRILAMIERQLRLLLAAKTGGRDVELAAQEMGESRAYLLRRLRPQAAQFSLDELLAGFYAVLQADGELKLGASGEEVLTDLIIKLT